MDATLVETAHNVKRLGHLDIPGGGQVEVQGNYAYIGHMDPPHGTSIIDISNPRDPKIVSQIMLEGEYTHTHKARIVGDLMYTNVEQGSNRHFLRRGDRIPLIRARLEAEGKDASDEVIAAELKVSTAALPQLDAARERGYHDGGWKVYDVADRANPKEIAYVKTHGFGTHRFHVDENYAYISTEMEGYVGNILVIYDMKNPEKPEEVSRWCMPHQKLADGESAVGMPYGRRLHHGLRFGDTIWAAVWDAGYRIIDVSDIKNPTTVGKFDYHPPYQEPSHTLMPIPGEFGGRRIAVGIDEAHARTVGQPPAFMWILDVTDFSDIKALSTFHVGEADSPWARAPGGRFGAHQFAERQDGTLIYASWFSGGLRIIDVADPDHPDEVGSYIPEPCGGFQSPQANDVELGENGLIYMLDRNCGFDILEFNR